MILIKNIKQLVQILEPSITWVAGKDMANLNTLDNAYLIIEGEKIQDFGKMEDLPSNLSFSQTIDVTNRLVMPAFVDSHTHIVFAGSRELEFVDKIKGVSYEEIARKGGGIQNSAKRVQESTEEELFEVSMVRVNEVIRYGTGVLEIKSGYGLTSKDELKMLRVAKMIKQKTKLEVKTTFLGAHTIPKTYSDRNEYIDLVMNQMIPQVAAEGLADYCDVFCEKGFYTPEETEKILTQGLKYGLKPKIHANQLHISGGVQVGVKMNAISVDHLETMGEEEIEALKGSTTMPTLLPGAAFFLRMSYPPARRMMDAGLPVSLATDFNPGSSPSGNMQLMMSLACVQMRMTPEETIHATTINAAYALELQKDFGSITKGKTASLIITKPISSYSFIPYAFGSNHVERMILKGEVIN